MKTKYRATEFVSLFNKAVETYIFVEFNKYMVKKIVKVHDA